MIDFKNLEIEFKEQELKIFKADLAEKDFMKYITVGFEFLWEDMAYLTTEIKVKLGQNIRQAIIKEMAEIHLN